MRRLAVLVLLGLALLAPTARAQDPNPFDAGVTPTPTVTAAPSTDTGTSDRTLLLIGGGVLLVFVGIGWYITRDARSNLTAEDRRAVERGDVGTTLGDERGVGTVAGKRKAQRRKKAKAQRAARRANRPR